MIVSRKARKLSPPLPQLVRERDQESVRTLSGCLNEKSALLLTALFLLPGSAAAEPIDYASQLKPVLQAHCFKCHGEKQQKGELRLDTLSANFAKDRRAAERWHDVRDARQPG